MQSSQAQRHETESDVIDLGFAELPPPEVGRVLDEPGGEQKRNNAHRNINEENPAPSKVIGNPAAERRTYGGCGHYGNAVNSECHAALGGRKRVRKNGLFTGLEAATTRALQDPANDEDGQIWRQSTQK